MMHYYNHLDAFAIFCYNVFMRTTLTLDDDLLLTLKRKAAESNIPFKTIVNQTLQRGLEVMDTPTVYRRDYHTQARSLEMKQGYDPDKLGQAADEIEAEEEEGLKNIR